MPPVFIHVCLSKIMKYFVILRCLSKYGWVSVDDNFERKLSAFLDPSGSNHEK